MNTPNEPARLSTSLNAAASEAEQRAADAIADGNPESAEVTLRVAEQMRRLATNHQAEAILSGDATDDPAQVEPDTCETCTGTGGAPEPCSSCQSGAPVWSADLFVVARPSGGADSTSRTLTLTTLPDGTGRLSGDGLDVVLPAEVADALRRGLVESA